MSAKAELEKKIRETCTIYGDFLLSSGTRSPVYFDKYLFESDPILLDSICRELVPNLKSRITEFDYIAGLETGGIPIATIISHLTCIPTLFIRKKAKTYGTCYQFEGGNVVDRRLLVVEDVITSGGQAFESCEKLEKAGAIVHEVCCVILRSNSGKQLIESKYRFSPLFNFTEFV